jgi:N-glycosylase/DNA lyase
MKELLKVVENLKKSEVKNLVDARVREFKEITKKPSSEIFKELCFCILTANFNAEKTIKIQNEICDGFSILNEPQLVKKLETLGHRYPSARAKYILDVRKYKDSLKNIIKSFNTEEELREWLVKNVKGLGYKESSHFLRNIGFTNFAIIDFHIINILTRYNLIKKPKTLTKRKYLEIEGLLKKIAKKLDLNLAELDLYLWYIETGKILK